MFSGGIKTPAVGGLDPTYQVSLPSGNGSDTTLPLPMSSISRDSELSTCTTVYLLIVCSCTFHAWKWTTAVMLSIWAECLLKGWLERLAFLHLALQQESCFYLSVHPVLRHYSGARLRWLSAFPSLYPFAFLWKIVLGGDGFLSSLGLLKNYWKRITVGTRQESLLRHHGLWRHCWPILSQCFVYELPT